MLEINFPACVLIIHHLPGATRIALYINVVYFIIYTTFELFTVSTR